MGDYNTVVQSLASRVKKIWVQILLNMETEAAASEAPFSLSTNERNKSSKDNHHY